MGFKVDKIILWPSWSKMEANILIYAFALIPGKH
jgi:hypothetical protein